jgi:hypothetical protein
MGLDGFGTLDPDGAARRKVSGGDRLLLGG